MLCPHRFCVWRGLKNKSNVCHVVGEEHFLVVQTTSLRLLNTKKEKLEL